MRDMPALPTMAESGFPDFILVSWMGLFGPAGLPDAIRDRIAAAAVRIGKNPELQQRLRNAGIEPVGSDAAAFSRFVEAEGRKWRGFVARTGVQIR
jgi:tripartite-type tricarboxylate transporter receptor subunit TctC